MNLSKEQYIKFKNLIKELDNQENIIIWNDFKSKLVLSTKLNEDIIRIKCCHNIIFSQTYFPIVHIDIVKNGNVYKLNKSKIIPKNELFIIIFMIIVTQLFITITPFREDRVIILIMSIFIWFGYFIFYSYISNNKIDLLLNEIFQKIHEKK